MLNKFHDQITKPLVIDTLVGWRRKRKTELTISASVAWASDLRQKNNKKMLRFKTRSKFSAALHEICSYDVISCVVTFIPASAYWSNFELILTTAKTREEIN